MTRFSCDKTGALFEQIHVLLSPSDLDLSRVLDFLLFFFHGDWYFLAQEFQMLYSPLP